MQLNYAVVIIILINLSSGAHGKPEAMTEQEDMEIFSNSIHQAPRPRWKEIQSEESKASKNLHNDPKKLSQREGLKLYTQLQEQLVEHTIRQRVAENDHFLMEKWLVDNINDLHRELKQTESDFEHYTKVTKEIIAQNERLIKQQLTNMVPHVPYFVAQVPHSVIQPVAPMRSLIISSLGHNWSRWRVGVNREDGTKMDN